MLILVLLLATAASVPAADSRRPSLLDDPAFFPIAVWVQQPRNAEKFKAAGINLYVGLWNGPTGEQLETLRKFKMPVICHQNAFALEHKDDPIILAWMHGDEPDNAQALRDRKGWGPPILPSKIQSDYEKIRAADPTRPVLLNLGQGVAWDNYIGRGTRRNHPEDYPEYAKGADIVSFDIYPVVHDHKDVAGKLEFVARGVERLQKWAGTEKTVWNCIECTHISNPDAKATPDQIRSEVWMSLIHGSRGIIYFVHQFKPAFNESAILADPENLAAITRINAQIKELAPVLNSPSLPLKITDQLPIATMKKKYKGETYLFSVGMENRETEAVIAASGFPQEGTTAEVLGENRTLKISDGQIRDHFKPYEVHLYKIASSTK